MLRTMRLPPSFTPAVNRNGNRKSAAPGKGIAPMASSRATMKSAAFRLPLVPVKRPSRSSDASASTSTRVSNVTGGVGGELLAPTGPTLEDVRQPANVASTMAASKIRGN